MPNDALTLNVIVGEIDAMLGGGRVERITAPSKDVLILTIYRKNLLISCHPSSPRIHISTAKYENPIAAYSFCMLARKYLEKSIFLGAHLINSDRIVRLNFCGSNELYDKKNYSLVFELMSRQSNIFLLDDEDKILGSLRQVSFKATFEQHTSSTSSIVSPLSNVASPSPCVDSERLLLYGAVYKAPVPQKTAYNKLTDFGLSKETIREIAYRNESSDILTEQCLINSSKNHNLQDNKYPLYFKDDHSPLDFTIQEYGIYKGFACEMFEKLNQAADTFYKVKEYLDKSQRQINSLAGAVNKATLKLDKKIAQNQESILKGEKALKYKTYGDLILSNIWQIKPKQEMLLSYDYEQDNDVQIPLNPELGPSQNAAAYYKRYTKAKRGAETAEKYLTENLSQNDYLKSILWTLENCRSSLIDDIKCKKPQNDIEKSKKPHSDDGKGDKLPQNDDISGWGEQDMQAILVQIEAELTDAGIIKSKKPQKQPKKNKSNKKYAKPKQEFKLLEKIVDGYTIRVGQNNLQNDYLTFEVSAKNDLWFHVKNYHGAHVVVSNRMGESLPDTVLLEAATLAAKNSSAKNIDKVEVDYTQIRHVKRLHGGNKGMVTYSGHKTILVKDQK